MNEKKEPAIELEENTNKAYLRVEDKGNGEYSCNINGSRDDAIKMIAKAFFEIAWYIDTTPTSLADALSKSAHKFMTEFSEIVERCALEGDEGNGKP